jgi:phospholipid/cholesterol/gamma-HCH transport system ATP-binding protein
MACAKHTADRLVILKEGVMHGRNLRRSSDDEWVRSFI